MRRFVTLVCALSVALATTSGGLRPTDAANQNAVNAKLLDPRLLGIPASALPAGSTVAWSHPAPNSELGNPYDAQAEFFHSNSYVAMGRINGYWLRMNTPGAFLVEYLASIFPSAAKAKAALDDVAIATAKLSGSMSLGTCAAGDSCSMYAVSSTSGGGVYVGFVRGPILGEWVGLAIPAQRGVDLLRPLATVADQRAQYTLSHPKSPKKYKYGSKFVSKKVHGKTKRVRVCKQAPARKPPPVPTATLPASVFETPSDVALDAQGNIYVSDTQASKIYKLSADGHLLANFGAKGTGPGQFVQLWGIAVDSAGQVYAADAGGHSGAPSPGVIGRIQKFSSSGNFLAQFVLGTKDVPAPATDLVVDEQGNLYVTASFSSYKVIKLSPSGQMLGDIQVPHDAMEGIARDTQGNLYVASQDSSLGSHPGAVTKLSPSGQILAQFDSTTSGPGVFDATNGVAVDQAGNIYVTSGSSKIEKLSPQGQLLAAFNVPAPQVNETYWGLAVDDAGNIYVAQDRKVVKLSPTGQVLATFTGVSQ